MRIRGHGVVSHACHSAAQWSRAYPVLVLDGKTVIAVWARHASARRGVTVLVCTVYCQLISADRGDRVFVLTSSRADIGLIRPTVQCSSHCSAAAGNCYTAYSKGLSDRNWALGASQPISQELHRVIRGNHIVISILLTAIALKSSAGFL